MTTDVLPTEQAPTFAAELCAWRAAQGKGQWTQKQAAKHLGVELGTYRNWEQGKHEPASYVLSLLRQTISKPTTK
jgi:DNA-binding transcriptional regulator YiaG